MLPPDVALKRNSRIEKKKMNEKKKKKKRKKKLYDIM